MARRLLAAAALLGFLQVSSSFDVKDSTGKVCIIANLTAAFTVEYKSNGQKQFAHFFLPQNATTQPHSSCGDGNTSNPILALSFGAGHLLRLNFSKTVDKYQVEQLTFRYNLSDTTLFHNSTEGKVMEASQKSVIQAHLDTEYRCINSKHILMKHVNITFSNVTLEAFPTNGTFSRNMTECSEDMVSTTTVVPTTPKQTTAKHTTSQVPTASPAPTALPPNPAVGRYNVTGTNGTCVLASMGLQLNITYQKKDEKMGLDLLNFIPHNTTASGKCDNTSAFLNLTFEKTKIIFHFVLNASSDKFFLQGVSVSTTLPSEAKAPIFEASNNSMSELRATVGNSYKCSAEENLQVTDKALVNVFNVQVQVFKVDGDKFGAVEECQLDENNMLIPIIVGAALAGLVLIVLIAYLSGRRRSHAGYQTI
ncbi:lysosome-associated membrane glycoprotein 1 [Aythya fuligula]|uniref:Lysosome-associated membrane glycoprotein 1 n=1 Tax=Aythya fuligula TaxID=219594 RepID=A0A6J3E739_AYTFU|nr:lysosome-associated membrane glycoprotein 1 [Aythya fuligula]